MDLIIRNAKLRNKTNTVDIGIDDGKIILIEESISDKADLEIDASGNLVVPPFIEPHIHLDKVNIVDVVRPNESGTLITLLKIL